MRQTLWAWLYALLWWLAPPWVNRYLRRRARKQPDYLLHWDERWQTLPALSSPSPAEPAPIWIHAVSVGETRAAAPLIAALQAHFPDVPLLVTQMTPTGRATAHALFGEVAQVRYLPYDTPSGVRRFLAAHRPRFGVLMETELWPHLIQACHAAEIPLFLANARLSAHSARGYQRLRGLIRPALAALTGIAAQTPDDAARLQALGAQSVRVCGNLKFDILPPPEAAALAAVFRQRIGTRPVWLAASTREGEEALLLAALPDDLPALTVIVPRHPQRFEAVAALLTARGVRWQRRSTDEPIRPDTQVWLGDSMGELFAYYQAADLAFVGGSLLPLGGQNLIEPASVGCPVVVGFSTFNFAEAAALSLAAGAAQQVQTAEALMHTVQTLLADPAQRQAMAAAGLRFAEAHRGATARTLAYLLAQLGEEAASSASTVV